MVRTCKAGMKTLLTDGIGDDLASGDHNDVEYNHTATETRGGQLLYV